ncbi:MAG TPA: carboxymuconolactone decarboxylase family protein [Baekduia sp.]|uniref:carboxymuconolactone decarboxylase family protein n=1 Tax=Baekduia sp. TaxID=2600305 RepID=UPI002D792236|nr:carboxymuconolactone decarboxylase family protein [Baekduia sp.]HET6508139.1 carboxymuconolactone decarboxylase family protein [Baekduia sp.]
MSGGDAGGGPRIPPGGKDDIGAVNWTIARVLGVATGGPPPHVFTTLARHRRIFRPWLRFAGRLMPGGTLPRAESELVILRVARVTGSDYEWAQHVRLGRQAGLSDAEIERVRLGGEAPGWTVRQALLLRAVDELHDHDRIGDALWSELAREYREHELIEICLLAGHYIMLAMTLNSLGVQVEPEPTPGAPASRATRLLQRVAARRR